MAIKVLLFTVRPDGFDPGEISVPAGKYLIAVNNRSGANDVSLQLDRVAGGRLKDVVVPGRRLDWRDLFELSPGQYTLSEAGHPSWVTRITVTSG